MFDPLIYLLFAVLSLTLFSGMASLVIAIWLRDGRRLEKLLDSYLVVFESSAAAVIGALRMLQRKDTSSKLPEDHRKRLPPPEPDGVIDPKFEAE
jgi:hypothetical protein